MGNSESKTVHHSDLDIKDIKLTHPRLKNAQMKSSLGNESIHGKFPVNDIKDYNAWVHDVKTNPGNGLQGVLNPVKHSYDKAGMCGSSGNINAQYQFFPFTLEDQIVSRQEAKHRNFEENQLWYLIYTFADVGSKFHNMNSKVGDIRPANVCINDEGLIKVMTKHTFPQDLDNYQKTFYDKEKTYLAPEEVKDLQIGKSQTTANIDTSEAFSAGLTVLDASILQNSENIYDKNGNMDYELLQGKKQNLKNSKAYGNLLKHTILNMTETIPQNRMNLNSISHWLDPFSQQIINLETFHCKMMPDKLNKTANENPISHQINYEPQGFYQNRQSIPQTVQSQILKDYPRKQQINITSNEPIRTESVNGPLKLESGAPRQNYNSLPVQRESVPFVNQVYQSNVPQRQTVLQSKPSVQQGSIPRQTIVQSIPHRQTVLQSIPQRQTIIETNSVPQRQTIVETNSIPQRQTILQSRPPVVVSQSQLPNVVHPPQRQTVIEKRVPVQQIQQQPIVYNKPVQHQLQNGIVNQPAILRKEHSQKAIHQPVTIQNTVTQVNRNHPVVSQSERRQPLMTQQYSPRHTTQIISPRKIQERIQTNPLPPQIYKSQTVKQNYHYPNSETKISANQGIVKTETIERNGDGKTVIQTTHKVDGPTQMYHQFAESVLPGGKKTQTKTIQTTVNPEGTSNETKTVTKTEIVESYERREDRPTSTYNVAESKANHEFSSLESTEKGKDYIKQLEEKIRQSKRMYPTQ